MSEEISARQKHNLPEFWRSVLGNACLRAEHTAAEIRAVIAAAQRCVTALGGVR